MKDDFKRVTFYWTDPYLELSTSDVWVWWEGKDGSGYVFSKCECGGAAAVDVPRQIDRVGYLVRFDCSSPGGSEWGSAGKIFPEDRFVCLESDRTEVWLDPDSVAVDENDYYLIGVGTGDMAVSGWDHARSADRLMMTRREDYRENIYTITVDMRAGDMFQICCGGTWDEQYGIGFVRGVEYCDGINPYDGKEYTEKDKKCACVRGAGGEVVFVGFDEFGRGFGLWNIMLAEGMDGVYELTFSTLPVSRACNRISWRRLGETEISQILRRRMK